MDGVKEMRSHYIWNYSSQRRRFVEAAIWANLRQVAQLLFGLVSWVCILLRYQKAGAATWTELSCDQRVILLGFQLMDSPHVRVKHCVYHQPEVNLLSYPNCSA
jgi:hypothetical protein